MVISATRVILLSQLKSTREEIVKLRKDFDILQRVYYETATDSLSNDERKLFEMVREGKLDSKILRIQTKVTLSGLFPDISGYGCLYHSYCVRSADNKKALESLGIKKGLLTGVSDQLSPEVSHQFLEFLGFDFPEPVPLFIGVEPNGISLLDFKKRCPVKVFNRFIEVTSHYVDSMREALTVFQEVDNFLQRDEVTIDYLKKNFQELYKIYEDGKEIHTRF